MDNRKKKVLVASNYCGLKTGFGGFIRELFTYLHKTGKYDLTLYAAQVPWEHSDFQRWPWKTYGTLPTDPAQMAQINADPGVSRAVNYGELYADKVVKEVKPDIFILSEDIWCCKLYSQKSWWGKIPCMVHTTLDSRPMWPDTVKVAKKTPLFFSWADFATKELHKMGVAHARTLRGSVNTDVFRRLPDEKRLELRKQLGIPENAFLLGMLSRNQLRKSFPNILRAFKMFTDEHPEIDARLLFFTHWSEGWKIPARCKEMGIDESKVLATYKCRATGNYFVMPFKGENIDNPSTGQKGSLITVNTQHGLTEEQVNEWYNLLDAYVHAFTSGGQERSIQEAKLAELITLVTDYSCGEDACEPEAASLPLEWEEYREPNDAEFIKATTLPRSIVSQLEKVMRMSGQERRDMGEQARKWVLRNFSIEVIGKQFEELIDAVPFTDYDFNFDAKLAKPQAEIDMSLVGDDFIKHCYAEILQREPDEGGFEYWQKYLAQSTLPDAQNELRNRMIEAFRTDAAKHNARHDTEAYAREYIGPEPAEQRVLITMPQSLGDCMYMTALLRDAREQYHDKKLYLATRPAFMEVFRHLVGTYIDYLIPWTPDLDDPGSLEGACGKTKQFQVVLNPHFPTQKNLSYRHNGEDKTAISVEYPH